MFVPKKSPSAESVFTSINPRREYILFILGRWEKLERRVNVFFRGVRPVKELFEHCSQYHRTLVPEVSCFGVLEHPTKEKRVPSYSGRYPSWILPQKDS